MKSHVWGGAPSALLGILVCACGGSSSSSPGGDSGALDAAHDTKTAEMDGGGPADTGSDATSRDAAPSIDAGAPETGTDAGTFTTVPLSGCSPSYSATVTVGGSQSFSMIVDTGSTTLAVAAQGCTSCTSEGISPLYTPGSSAVDDDAQAESFYDRGEIGWTGEIYQDTVSVGGIGGLATRPSFAAIEDDIGGFLSGQMCDTASGVVPSSTQGIIGFGTDDALVPGTTSYFDTLVNAGVVPNVFAIQLCHTGGTLWLGGYDPKATTAPPQYTPMTMTYGYDVTLAEIGVTSGDAGTDIHVPVTQQVSLDDSGGPNIILPDPVFQAVANALNQSPAMESLLGASWLEANPPPQGSCVNLMQTPDQVDALLPPLTLVLGDTNPISVQVAPTQSYLRWFYPGALDAPSQGYSYCQAMINFATATGIADAGANAVVDLGETLMRGHVLVYDRGNQRMGIAPAQACP